MKTTKRALLTSLLLLALFLGFFLYLNSKIEGEHLNSEKYSTNKAESVEMFATSSNSQINDTKSTSSLQLVFVGDIMLGRYVDKRIKAYDAKRGDNIAPIMDSGVRSIIQKADIAVGNLESPFSSGGVHDNLGIVFNADAQYANRLYSAGFDILSTANNHAADIGVKGVGSTILALQNSSILPVGTNFKPDEVGDALNCHEGQIIHAKGYNVGFLAYSYTEYNDGGASPGPDVCDWNDFDTVEVDLSSLRKKSDYVMVMVHTGVENSRAPTIADKEKFKKLVDLGATAVIGHHPHVLGGVELYNGGVIAYSMGNFIFDQIEPEQKASAILQIDIDSKGTLSYKIIPIKIEDLCCPKLLNVL